MACIGSSLTGLAAGLVAGERMLARFATLSLLLVLGALLWAFTFAPAPPAAGMRTDSSEAHAAIDAWETMWTQLDAHGVDALRPEMSDPSLRAAGDTVFMRYRNLWGPLEDAERLAFQLAALSGNPERKRALIAPLTRAEAPLIRLRAHLELARLARRGGDFAAARAEASAALAVAEVAERVRADAWFILAESAWEQGRLDEAETALTAAIAADPGFWDARRLRLEVLARQLTRPRQRDAQCLDQTRRMIEDLGALPALAEDQTQFRDLADRFASENAPAHVALALIAGLGYRWSGAERRALELLSRPERWRGRLPEGCERLILERIAALVSVP